MNQKQISVALLALACISASARADGPATTNENPRVISIKSVGFAKGATNHVTSESATCPGRSYTLQIVRERRQVILTREDTATSNDLSATVFGTTFLTKNLYGKFFFNCPRGVGITFWGFEAQASGAPKPVHMVLVLGRNGEVITDPGPREESYETIGRQLVPATN